MNNFVIPSLDKPNTDQLSEYLTSSMNAFSDITGIPVTFFNEKNQIVQEFQPDNKICRMFSTYSDEQSPCRHSLVSAGQFTARLGEPYIFLCKAGLANIATSLIVNGTFIGYFIAGPLVMGELRPSTLKNFETLNNLSEINSSIAKLFAGKMKTFKPNQVSEIALLFFNNIITSIYGNSDYNALRSQYDRESKINIDIQKYKKAQVSFEYPYGLEKTLIESVLNGQVESARSGIADMLNKFSIMEAGDLEAIKAKCLWLFANVIRITNKNNNVLNHLLDTDYDVINRLSEADSLDSLLTIATDLICVITKNMISSVYNGSSQIVTNALQFINKNYTGKITLNMIEDELHVNSSYFSTLFKHEMGISFTQYINDLRVARSCELLVTTNLSIIDISLSTGFDDQSYFTKVFKLGTGMTPKQYRNKFSGISAYSSDIHK